jgi:hypothetical protein
MECETMSVRSKEGGRRTKEEGRRKRGEGRKEAGGWKKKKRRGMDTAFVSCLVRVQERECGEGD